MKLLCLFFALVSAMSALSAPTDYDIERYDVLLTPDFETKSITGSTRVTLRALRDGIDAIEVSQNALDTTHSNGGTIEPAAKGMRRIKLPRPLRNGERATIDVHYSGKPLRGLIFGRDIVHTSYFACDWMICAQDRPGDKAALTLTLDLPPGLTSLGPGAMTRAAGAKGREHHVWSEKRPYSTFLFGFAAGRMTSAFLPGTKPTLAVLGEHGSGDASHIQAMFATTSEMLRFFEDKAGVPFPHPRYTQLLVTGTEAQEASHFSIIGTQMIDPILKTPQEDWVIAHELAHQWWGNLVTCTDWSQFWLNEGIVTFMTAAWKEHKHGRAAYDREMELARKRLAVAAEAGFDKPLAWPGEYPSLRIRRAVQYAKGALFLDALRTELGEAKFWAGLKRFTQDHAGRTVTSKDFQSAMERAAKRDLTALFKQWVTG